ncbi:M50 family metallopeptidase [Actinopolymorpha sp. B17G11]|uniref:M50 family metallopeptidase n=1 Tax=Actinopolymorpha sp. B17G11 TaxID=3160861 RepID=UPI0032E3CBEF
MSSLDELWKDVTGVQQESPAIEVLLCSLPALAAVMLGNLWRWARNVVTIAHEGGHALVALLVGRRLSGIRLHSDTSGVTISRGRPTGPGMVATALAGYVAPSLLGLGFAAMLTVGRITALLWLSIAALAAMLLLVRNAYGILSILTTGLAIFAVSWFAPERAQAALAYSFTWFLLFAGVRPIGELQQKRARRAARDSDADQLARLTGVPGLVWVTFFGLVAVGALVMGASLLVSWTDLAPTLDPAAG